MQFDAALVKEQGVTFAVVVVKKHVVNSLHESQKAIASFSQSFPNTPIILMGQDARGVPTFRGRRDIVNFLSRVHVSRLPWKRYSTAA